MRRFLACHLAGLPAALLVAATACGPSVPGGGAGGDDDHGQVDATGTGTGTGGGTGDPVTQQCQKMDLVFVVDDSMSMGQEQTNLAANFPTFADLLNSYMTSSGQQLDYRAAITTTGITASFAQQITAPPLPPITLPPVTQNGRDGRFVQSCDMARPWLERGDASMATTFACAAKVGTQGPGLEMPLRAAELAIQPAPNAGFLRDDALLGIIILTDEDDCSFRMASGITINGFDTSCISAPNIPPVGDFVAAIDQIKGERGRWAAAVIAGRTSCNSDFGSAREGVRLEQFAAAAGPNVVFGDICAGDLTGALHQALDTFQTACENFPPID